MNRKLVFVDVETTSVRPDRRAWDIGLITRYPDGRPDVEWQAFVNADDLDLGNADQRALAVGRFYDRHPTYAWAGGVARLLGEYEAMQWVESITRGAILVGHNVAFDIATLDARIRDNGMCPGWDYHYVEVSSLVAGHVLGSGKALLPPPWKFDMVAGTVGVPEQPDDDRHTAIGDARQVRAIWDALNTPPTPDPATAEQPFSLRPAAPGEQP